MARNKIADKRLNLSLTNNQYNYIEQLANNKGSTMSSVIRELIRSENIRDSPVPCADLIVKLDKLKDLGIVIDIVVSDDLIQFLTYDQMWHRYYKNSMGYLNLSYYISAIELGFNYRKLR